jgi:hypothetical protein
MSDLDADALRERVSGEQMVHRLRDWTDGDTLYGVTSFNQDTGTSSGKTFREGGEYGEDAEQKARNQYERPGLPMSGVTVLFRATVRNPRTEPRNPADPGEPPLKFATLTDVDVLDWKQTGQGDGDV